MIDDVPAMRSVACRGDVVRCEKTKRN